ncbi:MAG: carbon storage regulator CsrA [Candidatus Eremiobacteraeota bacterium]|nr:carbon storage regulator CsrA [Candidatus Eremiobacteraeota bacterium]
MLVLSRKINQSIMVGDNVRIVIVGVDRDQVKLGIEAPRDIAVHRSEVYEEIQRANQSAAAGGPRVGETTVTAARAQLKPRQNSHKKP